jgi:hypothetical protein
MIDRYWIFVMMQNPGDSFTFLLKLDIMEVVSSLAHKKTHQSFTGPGPVAVSKLLFKAQNSSFTYHSSTPYLRATLYKPE